MYYLDIDVCPTTLPLDILFLLVYQAQILHKMQLVNAVILFSYGCFLIIAMYIDLILL